MYTFDPAINYGPNDAGVSAFSIVLALIGVLLAFILLGTIYNFLANLLKNGDENQSE